VNPLQKALTPFVALAESLPADWPDDKRLYFCSRDLDITVGDVRRLAQLTFPTPATVPPLATKSVRKATLKRAEEAFGLIAESIQIRGLSPTVREFQEMIGVRSTSSANYWLRTMAALGWIDWQPRMARSIRIIRGAK